MGAAEEASVGEVTDRSIWSIPTLFQLVEVFSTCKTEPVEGLKCDLPHCKKKKKEGKMSWISL